MRGTFLFLCFFCMVAINVTAQTQRFQAGLVAGANLSQIDGDRLGGFNQPGLSAGVKVATILSERWQVSLELLYSQQGSRRTNNDDPFSAYEKIRLNFIEVPVLINFKEWKFHLSGGVAYNRLINFKVIDASGVDVTDSQDFNENMFALVLGGIYYFQENMGVEVRWMRSLSDLQAQKSRDSFIGRSLSFKLVYLF